MDFDRVADGEPGLVHLAAEPLLAVLEYNCDHSSMFVLVDQADVHYHLIQIIELDAFVFHALVYSIFWKR